jgi:hypothetical protein
LLEVCEGQILFARKSSKLPRGQKAPLPAFGGTRGPDIEKSLYEIEDAFVKYIGRFRALDYNIMDVKATKWHDDFGFFMSGVKDLEVMLTNVVASAFDSVSTLQSAVELLQAFYHLSKRPSMKNVIEKQASHVFEMFKAEYVLSLFSIIHTVHFTCYVSRSGWRWFRRITCVIDSANIPRSRRRTRAWLELLCGLEDCFSASFVK